MLLAISSLATLVWVQHVFPFPPLPWQAGRWSGLLSDSVEFPKWHWRTSSTLRKSEERWTRGRWVGEGSRAETCWEGLTSSLKSFLCVFKKKKHPIRSVSWKSFSHESSKRPFDFDQINQELLWVAFQNTTEQFWKRQPCKFCFLLQTYWPLSSELGACVFSQTLGHCNWPKGQWYFGTNFLGCLLHPEFLNSTLLCKPSSVGSLLKSMQWINPTNVWSVPFTASGYNVLNQLDLALSY